MPRELGRFTLGNAGFIEVFTEEDGTNYLYVTTFNPGTMILSPFSSPHCAVCNVHVAAAY